MHHSLLAGFSSLAMAGAVNTSDKIKVKTFI